MGYAASIEGTGRLHHEKKAGGRYAADLVLAIAG